MRKLLLIIFILSVQLIPSCNSPKQEKTEKKVNVMKKHVKIDDKIIATRDPMAVIDPLWWSVSIYDSKEKYENDLKPFSLHQRAVFAMMWYMTEVNNGGHSQFYSNSTGIVWEDAMNGFALIGISEGNDILEESARRFGKNPSFDREEREKALDLLDKDFDDLDSRFYQLDSTVNITERIADYIQDNKKAFYFEGDIEMPKE